jgi:hypothetical protein
MNGKIGVLALGVIVALILISFGSVILNKIDSGASTGSFADNVTKASLGNATQMTADFAAFGPTIGLVAGAGVIIMILMGLKFAGGSD